jgi:hypothetical protein
LVEDQKVATAMVNFRNSLKERAHQEVLEILALELCRDSIAESWKILLPSIKPPLRNQTSVP